MIDTEHARTIVEHEGDPRSLVESLKAELQPHVAGEEQHLYPAVKPLLRGNGMATATMRINHRFLEEYID
jgi:iron-sulfur cluster repair protein YtfE (RIC family)